jgi:hypothetical protein
LVGPRTASTRGRSFGITAMPRLLVDRVAKARDHFGLPPVSSGLQVLQAPHFDAVI